MAMRPAPPAAALAFEQRATASTSPAKKPASIRMGLDEAQQRVGAPLKLPDASSTRPDRPQPKPFSAAK
jgi:hypothetical protein